MLKKLNVRNTQTEDIQESQTDKSSHTDMASIQQHEKQFPTKTIYGILDKKDMSNATLFKDIKYVQRNKSSQNL